MTGFFWYNKKDIDRRKFKMVDDIKLTDWISMVGTVVALFTSACAILQTKKQIELSNKQLLFEKRVKVFYDLISLKDSCIYTLDRNKNNSLMNNVDELFKYLTLNNFFEDLPSVTVINKDEESLEKIRGLGNLLTNIKKIGLLDKELSFLFKKQEELNSISEFLDVYQDLLYELLRYYDNIQKRDLEIIKLKFSELEDKFQKLEDLSVEKKLRDSIKLF